MMKKKLMAVIIGSVMALSSTLVHAETFCGKQVSAGVFLVDYSGSMMETVTVNEESLKKITLVKNLLSKLSTAVPEEADVLVGVGTLAPHSLAITPQLLTGGTFNQAVSTLPENMEIFGRNTNIGEGLIGLDRRIQESSREADQPLRRYFAKNAGVIVVFDGGVNNRGQEAVPALKAFAEKYPNAKVTFLSLAQTDEEKQSIQVLAEAVNAPVYDAYKITTDEFLYQEFVETTLYKPCVATFTLSADTLFDFDKSILKPKGVKEIARVSEEIQRYKEAMAETGMTLSISAHTDRIGTYVYNDKLSQRRLDAVLRELEQHGIDLSLFTEKIAAGERQPITGDACKGIRGKAVIKCLQPDRRVEIRLKSLDTL